MATADTVAALTAFEGRGAGTNAERRAALWLAAELSSERRDATVETFWCRPNWALAHAWHGGLAIAGSLVSVGSPKVGAGLILLALVSLGLDALTGVSLGRRLSPVHASQNVVSAGRSDAPVARLIITANYDTGRMGVVYRPPLRRLAAAVSTLTGGRAPGWQAWLALGFIALLAIAVVRDMGTAGTTIDVLQLISTTTVVIAAGLLLELAGSRYGPGASDNASGVALTLALARALEAVPPTGLGIDVVLQGAGDGAMLGLTRYLRARRGDRGGGPTMVLGIGPCGAGQPRFWVSDGSAIPLRYGRRLRQLAASAAAASPELNAAPHRGRGTSPAYPGRFAGLSAIAIGCLDGHGLAPRSHRPTDRPGALDDACGDGLMQLALTLVDVIDADVAPTANPLATAARTVA